MTSPTETTPTSCSSLDDGDLGDVPLAHLAHDVVDVVVERASDRAGGHHFGDAQPAEPSPRLWITRRTSRSLKMPISFRTGRAPAASRCCSARAWRSLR